MLYHHSSITYSPTHSTRPQSHSHPILRQPLDNGGSPLHVLNAQSMRNHFKPDTRPELRRKVLHERRVVGQEHAKHVAGAMHADEDVRLGHDADLLAHGHRLEADDVHIELRIQRPQIRGVGSDVGQFAVRDAVAAWVADVIAARQQRQLLAGLGARQIQLVQHEIAKGAHRGLRAVAASVPSQAADAFIAQRRGRVDEDGVVQHVLFGLLQMRRVGEQHRPQIIQRRVRVSVQEVHVVLRVQKIHLRQDQEHVVHLRHRHARVGVITAVNEEVDGLVLLVRVLQLRSGGVDNLCCRQKLAGKSRQCHARVRRWDWT
mmetsp:Transcript_24923/g.69289  ORF Transcript_24923/g.69289 Transcript_24923/m.69289 type:complete len:317 (+) Transcript_24923:40-990(+)